MRAEQYNAIAAWFNARPVAKKALRLVCTGCVAAVYALYAALLVALLWQRRGADFARVFCVPAFVFLSGSALRAGVNRPRPYEALNFTPLFPKFTVGKSMPSRHCFSAAAIAVTAFGVSVPLGAALAVLAACIAVSRVVSGVHYPSDVIAGLCYGTGMALLGLGVFGLLHIGG